MKKTHFAVAMALLATVLSGSLNAAAAAGRVAAPYLELPMSTRATGMGEAFTGIADDDAALYYNPAGIAQLDLNPRLLHAFAGLWGHQLRLFGNGFVSGGTWAWTSGSSIGISYELIGIDPILRTQALPDGSYDQAYADRNFTFTAGGTLLGLSYAWQATKLFSLGGTLKFINQKVDDTDGWGVAVDLGLFTKPQGIPGLSAGLAIQNIGASPDASAPLPVNLRAGAGYTIDHIFSTPERPVDKLLLGFDLVLPIVPIDAATNFSFGTEYSRWFEGNQFVAARVGYRFPDDLGALAGLTVGLGYGMEFPGTLLTLDYAFVPYGDLGVSNRISLTGNFGLKKPKSPILQEAEKFGPPTGLQAVGGDKRVLLNWQASKAQVAGYNIYMSYNPAKGQWYKLNQRGLVKGSSVSSGGLYNNYNYYFAVTSVMAGTPSKESEKSAPVIVHAQGCWHDRVSCPALCPSKKLRPPGRRLRPISRLRSQPASRQALRPCLSKISLQVAREGACESPVKSGAFCILGPAAAIGAFLDSAGLGR